MSLDRWTLRRADDSEKFRNQIKETEQYWLKRRKGDLRPGTTASMAYSSSKCVTPGKELVDKLAAQLARTPLPELRHSHEPNASRMQNGQYSRNGTGRSMDSIRSRSRSSALYEREKGGPSAERRPEWSFISNREALEKPLSYRDPIYFTKVLNDHKLPGLGGVRSPPYPVHEADILHVPLRPYSQQPYSAEKGDYMHDKGDDNHPFLEDIHEDRLMDSNAGTKHAGQGEREKGVANETRRQQELRSTNLMEQLRRRLYKKHGAHLDCGKAAMFAEQRLFKAFDRFDTNTDGVISFAGFEETCRALMPELKEGQIRTLYTMLDADKNGRITLSDFILSYLFQEEGPKEQRQLMDRAEPKVTLRDYLSEEHQRSLSANKMVDRKKPRNKMELMEINETISTKMEGEDPELHIAMNIARQKCAHQKLPVSRGSKLHHMFHYFDPSKTGQVSTENFKRAFQMLKLRIEENQINFISKSLDPTGSGKVNYRDFMSFFKPQKVDFYLPAVAR